jgi:hypothetical protein
MKLKLSKNLSWLILLSLGLVGSGFLIFFPQSAKAERLDSASYTVTFGNFNVTSGEKSSASYTVTDTVGQTASGPFGKFNDPGASYYLGSGFQYVYQIKEFEFGLENLNIDLGTLYPDTLTTAATQTNLTVTSGGAGGYTVYAYETEPMHLADDSATIPDTTCDSGDCSETDADPWTLGTNYGFGFNASGTNVPTTAPNGFENSTYYRQFADNSAAESMQAVMEYGGVIEDDTASITYRAAVSGSQTAGEYSTSIVYVAVPGY